jgi:hypothetical protein
VSSRRRNDGISIPVSRLHDILSSNMCKHQCTTMTGRYTHQSRWMQRIRRFRYLEGIQQVAPSGTMLSIVCETSVPIVDFCEVADRLIDRLTTSHRTVDMDSLCTRYGCCLMRTWQRLLDRPNCSHASSIHRSAQRRRVYACMCVQKYCNTCQIGCAMPSRQIHGYPRA